MSGWIKPDYLDCAVYMYPSEAAAEDGENIGGSGFLVSIPLDRKASVLVVVTNAHVIDKGHMVARLNTKDGGKDRIPLDNAKWYRHPDGDDVAVCPINLTDNFKFNAVPLEAFVSEKDIESFEIGPGDEVFVVGRFINHEGKQRNTPSVRFGNIAQMPFESIDGQESFLVEAKSIAGYSGSPVFVRIPPTPQVPAGWSQPGFKPKIDVLMQVSPKRAHLFMPVGPWLLGIDWCHLHTEEPVWSELKKEPVSTDWYVKTNTGMMGVIPAWRLRDIFEGPEMKPVIDERREHHRAANVSEKPKRGGVELDSAEKRNPESPDHKERFRALLDAAAKTKPQDG